MSNELPHSFATQVKAPANIAWIKYWGKKGPQIPANASLSMTLRECVTLTQLEATPSSALKLELWFDGERNLNFEKSTLSFLNDRAAEISLLGQFSYKIQTQNSFPHSSGIASSASSMAALSYALGQLLNDHGHKTSNIFIGSMARLGSGSACRSLEGGFVTWGENSKVSGSSDLHATSITSQIHSDFLNAKDTVLVVSTSEKEVSSRHGHGTMNEHPFAKSRYFQAQSNFSEMLEGLKAGDWEKVGSIMEVEALTLHALMLTTKPGYILLEPKSLEIIKLIQIFRRESGLPVFFTIDAGPNIHLIYPESAHSKVEPFIRHELLPFTENGNNAIWDSMGEVGAQ